MDSRIHCAGTAPAPARSAWARRAGRCLRRCLTAAAFALCSFAAAAAPVVTSFTPSSGASTTAVTINGTGFSATPASNSVSFNGIAATVSSATTTKLVVAVPTGATTGKIGVTVAGQTGQSGSNFVVKPKITGFSPGSGSAGTTVTINGDGFSGTPGANTVTFYNNKTATVVSASVSQLVVTVPAGTTTGTIKVAVGGNTATSASNFTAVQVPVITSFTPAHGGSDTAVTITGSGFSSTRANNTVKFNGVAATVTSASATQLVVRSPDEATAGPLSVTVNGQTGTSMQNFFPPPWLHSIVPAGAPIGASVTLNGANFDPIAANNQVTFNGIPATVTAATFTTLQVTVPPGAAGGQVQITVGPETTQALPFYVLPANPPALAGLRAYLANPSTSSVTVYDVTANALVAAINVPAMPNAIAAASDGSRIYVGHNYGDALTVIDTATNTVSGTIPLGFELEGFSLSALGNEAYAWSGKQLKVITLATGAQQSLDLGFGNDLGQIYGAATDLSGTHLYVTYYQYDYYTYYRTAIFDTATHVRLGTYELPQGRHLGGTLPDPNGSRLYIHESGNGTVHVADGSTGAPISEFAVDTVPPPYLYMVAIDFEPDGSRMYLASRLPGQLTAVERSGHSPLQSLPLPQVGHMLSVSPTGTGFFIGSQDNTFRAYHYGPTGLILDYTSPIGPLVAMALDAGGTRAVITRSDAKLDIVDTATGAVTTSGVVGDESARIALVSIAAADRVAITHVNGEAPAGMAYANVPFDVVVQLRSANDIATVAAPRTVQLSLASGTGTLGGTTQCTVPTGRSSCRVTGVLLDTTQPAAVLRAASAGLTAGDSSAFAVTTITAATISGFTPTSGATGESVVISGSGFQPSLAVHPTVAFNGVVATVTAESNTGITAQVPPGATTGPITVTVGGVPATSAAPFRVKPAPLVALTTSPLASRWSDPFSVTVSVTPVAPATETPTGMIRVTDETNHVSCTIWLPATSCDIPPSNGSPASVLVSASYYGDDNYGAAQSPATPHIIAFYDTSIEIIGVSKEPSQAGESVFVTFALTPVSVPFPASSWPTGQVVVSDGANFCSFFSVIGLQTGGCLLPTPTAGTRQITARYAGDRNYATTASAPIAHSTSSAGGALPAGTELCGLQPNPTYPAPGGFVAIEQIPGGVPSFGVTHSISGARPLQIYVDLPQQGATTNLDRVDVIGHYDGPANTGITVNGLVAMTANGRFVVPDVPLQPGQNMLEVTATTLPGAQQTIYRAVTRDGDLPPLRLQIDDPGLFAPAVQGYRFDIGALPGGETVQSVAIDYDGDTAWDYQNASAAAAPQSLAFPQPGLHVATLRVTGSASTPYTATRAFLIRDPVEQRALMCDVYGYLRERLAANDAAGASLAYQVPSRTKYRAAFDELGTNMAQASTLLGHIVEGSFGPGFGDLSLVRDKSNQTRAGFPLRMTQGPDGVWRISEM